MQLTTDRLKYIYWRVDKEDKTLMEVLEEEFPDTLFFLLRVQDQDSGTSYTRRACLSYDQAIVEEAVAESNHIGCGPGESRYLMRTSFRNLQRGAIMDPNSKKYLCEEDYNRIPILLMQSLLQAQR